MKGIHCVLTTETHGFDVERLYVVAHSRRRHTELVNPRWQVRKWHRVSRPKLDVSGPEGRGKHNLRCIQIRSHCANDPGQRVRGTRCYTFHGETHSQRHRRCQRERDTLQVAITYQDSDRCGYKTCSILRGQKVRTRGNTLELKGAIDRGSASVQESTGHPR